MIKLKDELKKVSIKDLKLSLGHARARDRWERGW